MVGGFNLSGSNNCSFGNNIQNISLSILEEFNLENKHIYFHIFKQIKID